MSSYSYKVTRETTGPRGGSYSTNSYSSPTTYSPLYQPYDWVGDYDPVRIFCLTHTDMGSHMVLEKRDMVRARNFLKPLYGPIFWPYFELEEQARSYHSSYMTPSARTSRYIPPARTSTYTTYETSPRTYAPRADDGEDDPISPARHVLHGIPSVAHQRLTPVSMPAYSSPLMPYLLMDEDDVVVLPRRRTLARLNDELDDDPVLKPSFGSDCSNCCSNCGVSRPAHQVTYVARPATRFHSVPSNSPFVSGEDELRNWYEDRIHHAQAEASAIAQSRINELCTPKPRHISVTPTYTPKMYPEPVGPRLREYGKYRTPLTDSIKPIRRNIELKSRFSGAHDAAQNTYRRMGSGHLASMSLLGGPIVSKRTHSRFYNGERARSEVDMASRLLPSPRDDPNTHRRSGSEDREHKPAREPEPAAPTLDVQCNREAQEDQGEE